MKVMVDEPLCTGCGACTELCPEIFEIPEGAEVARVKVDVVPSALEAICRQAAEECPVAAILTED